MPLAVAQGEWNIVLDRGDEFQTFFQGERLQRGTDGLHDVLDRILRQNKLHATRLDFGKIQHVVDQAKQMLAVGLDIRQRLP